MSLAVNISVLGRKDLERRLKKLDKTAQKKIVRTALRASAKRAKERVDVNLSGVKVNEQTGVLRDAFRDAKIRGSTTRYMIRVGLAFPERDKLGIPGDSRYYYPAHVEYGHGQVPPHPYMRPAIDEHYTPELNKIADDIGDGLLRAAGRLV